MTRVPRTVVLADDQSLILRGLEGLLAPEEDFRVVASCVSGQSALEAIRREPPDVAVIDLNMSEVNGLAVLAAIVAEGLTTRTVFLTASTSDLHICEAVKAGAHGLVLKDGACDTLLQCLREVTAGRRWLPQEIVTPAVDRRIEWQKAGRVMLSELTKRELEVVQLVGVGLANRSIGNTLGLSEGTVKVHLHRIYQKLGIVNRASLAVLAATYRADSA